VEDEDHSVPEYDAALLVIFTDVLQEPADFIFMAVKEE
jgi:hypothetical protein